MLSLLIIFTFCLGAIIGSFLGVAVDRYNTNMTMGGHSRCFTCNRNLGALELVPIFSQLLLRGKCKGCKSKISNEYMLLEVLTGVVFVYIALKYLPYYGLVSPTYFFMSAGITAIIFCVLLIMSFYDYRHKVFPGKFLWAFAILSIFAMLLRENLYIVEDLLAGPILAFPFFFLWLISKGKWIGLGDAKLALGIGWFLGLSSGVTAILLAFWIGAAVAIVLMIWKKANYRLKTEVPFGPFLALGTFIAFAYSLRLEDILISIMF